MSKSVKSHNSSLSRRDKSVRENNAPKIKERIKEILYSVKEERQHIQNRLHQNDLTIQQLRQEYEMLRYEHDFDHLNEEEQTIIDELTAGLTQMEVDPRSILCLPPRHHLSGSTQGRELTKQQIIEVQELLMARLQQQLKQ